MSPIPLNWHEAFIINLAQILQPRVYVELGLCTCNLFNKLVPYAERLIGVDISPEAGKYMDCGEKTRFVNASTADFARELQVNPLTIDLLFIDADHVKEAVLSDFQNYFPFVASHGLILLHDTHPNPEHLAPEYCNNAYQAVAILSQNTSNYEMMTLPVAPGLTICRKRQAQLAWQEPFGESIHGKS